MTDLKKTYIFVWVWCLVWMIVFALVQTARSQDIISWDMSPVILRTEYGDLIVRHIDPANGDRAYVIYHSFEQDFTNVIQVIHVKQHGVCKVGLRSVKDGNSFILYSERPCAFFNKMDELYLRHISRPLEQLDGEADARKTTSTAMREVW